MSNLADKIKEMHIQPPSLLVEQVTKALTEAILKGVFKGGDQLVESELQKQFKISRSPIRETFRILETQGLVVVYPRKGTFVKKITRKDIEQHFPIRACLEGLAAGLAAPRITAEEIEEMTEEVAEMEKALAQKDYHTYMQPHVRFHEIFIAASGNDALIELLKNLRQHEVWYRLTYYYIGSRHNSVLIHKAILNALIARDAGKAQQLVRDHIMETADDFASSLPNGLGETPA